MAKRKSVKRTKPKKRRGFFTGNRPATRATGGSRTRRARKHGR